MIPGVEAVTGVSLTASGLFKLVCLRQPRFNKGSQPLYEEYSVQCPLG